MKSKCGELKRLYTICGTSFKTSAESDPDTLVKFPQGKNYIMYPHFFLQPHPIMNPLPLSSLPSDE